MVFHKNTDILLSKRRPKNLTQIKSKEIGWYPLKDCLSFFVWTGMFAFFHSGGNCPFCKHDLKLI